MQICTRKQVAILCLAVSAARAISTNLVSRDVAKGRPLLRTDRDGISDADSRVVEIGPQGVEATAPNSVKSGLELRDWVLDGGDANASEQGHYHNGSDTSMAADNASEPHTVDEVPTDSADFASAATSQPQQDDTESDSESQDEPKPTPPLGAFPNRTKEHGVCKKTSDLILCHKRSGPTWAGVSNVTEVMSCLDTVPLGAFPDSKIHGCAAAAAWNDLCSNFFIMHWSNYSCECVVHWKTPVHCELYVENSTDFPEFCQYELNTDEWPDAHGIAPKNASNVVINASQCLDLPNGPNIAASLTAPKAEEIVEENDNGTTAQAGADFYYFGDKAVKKKTEEAKRKLEAAKKRKEVEEAEKNAKKQAAKTAKQALAVAQTVTVAAARKKELDKEAIRKLIKEEALIKEKQADETQRKVAEEVAKQKNEDKEATEAIGASVAKDGVEHAAMVKEVTQSVVKTVEADVAVTQKAEAERRLCPLLGNRAVTYQELRKGLENQRLFTSEEKLLSHWNSLQPAQAEADSAAKPHADAAHAIAEPTAKAHAATQPKADAKAAAAPKAEAQGDGILKTAESGLQQFIDTLTSSKASK